METRSLTIADYDQLTTLWQRAGLSFRPNGRDSISAIATEIQHNPDGFIGLFDGESLVGFILATFDGRKGWINRLAIDPDYRRKGLGIMLIRKAEETLKLRGAKIIAALIEQDNTASLAMAQKAGYITHQSIIYVTKRESSDT